MESMKSKIAIILLVLFMLGLAPLQAKADETMYAVLECKNSQYYLVTDTKEYNFTYKGTQDIGSLAGEVISLSPTSQSDDTIEADNVVKTDSVKNSKSGTYQYVKIVSKDGVYYYENDSKDIEIRSDAVDLKTYVDKYCKITTEKITYSFENGNRTITIPWEQVTNIGEGDPYTYFYKNVTVKGRVHINTESYIQVGDKQYKVFFNNQTTSKNYRIYNKRYVTVTGKLKYKKDLRNNSSQATNEIYSSKYKLTYKLHYKSVKATGFVNNNLKIGKYILNNKGDKYKSFIIKLIGKITVKNDGVKSKVSKVVKPTKATKVSTTNLSVYKHLSSHKARAKTFKIAKQLHNGTAHNSCVYFSSQALREVGVRISKSTCVTNKFAYKLRLIGWKKIRSYKKLTPGSVCFTKDVWGGNGKPTHTYIFMGWVKKGDYSKAYICDNQAGEYGGKVLHVRTIAKKAKHKGKYKDAFGFAMVSPKTYKYVK